MATVPLELTPAMEAYLTALIYRNTRTSCCSLAALCALVTHDGLQRLLYERFAWSRRPWDFFAARRVREGSYLIIDDTCWVRWAQKSEAVSWVWSSTYGRAPRIAGTPISVGEVLARLHVHGSVPAVVGRYGDVSKQQVRDAIYFAGMFMELACAGRWLAE